MGLKLTCPAAANLPGYIACAAVCRVVARWYGGRPAVDSGPAAGDDASDGASAESTPRCHALPASEPPPVVTPLRKTVVRLQPEGGGCSGAAAPVCGREPGRLRTAPGSPPTSPLRGEALMVKARERTAKRAAIRAEIYAFNRLAALVEQRRNAIHERGGTLTSVTAGV
eukprot:Rhum_TRINITY_DN13209_c0_g1::Rhum_TRINITY_DN13209_c0_g1_i1::g.58019::m.58019